MAKKIFFMPSLWGNFRVVEFAVPGARESLPIPYVWSAILEVACLVRRTTVRRELWLSGGSA